jgi:DNA-binding NarL/FixJ family response regulator
VSEPLRIVIADDHPPTRAGVKLALDRNGFTVVGEAGNAPAAVAQALVERPDVSDTTVRRHVSSILQKLQVPDREAAVQLVRQRSRLARDG